jgi:signal transduction histidine kinase
MAPIVRQRMKLPRLSSTLLTAYVMVGVVLLAATAFYHVNGLMSALREDAQVVSEIYGRFCSVAADPNSGTETMDVIFEQIIRRIDFPVIITDRMGKPTQWVNVEMPPDQADQEELRLLAEEMDRRVEPIDVRLGPGGPLISRVHFAESRRIRELRRIPFILVGVIILFGGIGLWIIYVLRAQEQRALWVGMARETAHQLGTPLSGLAGWVELLRDESLPPREIAAEMAIDLARLEEIASRFGRIGSQPRLRAVDLPAVINEVLSRLRSRAPHLQIDFGQREPPIPRVHGDPQLLAWVVENLVRNAIDACRGGENPGRVLLSCSREVGESTVRLSVRDNGRGMTRAEARRAFRPGHTTKETGWGLGLPLARRIIEDDHGGRIFIAWTRPDEGTEVEVHLPLDSA